MSLINRQSNTLIAPRPRRTSSTLRKGQAGTENLTQVRRGHGKRQRVSFILEEVPQLKSEPIEAARKTKRKCFEAGFVMKKKILKIVCETFGHCFGKWKCESDPKRCVFRFRRKYFICGGRERRDF